MTLNILPQGVGERKKAVVYDVAGVMSGLAECIRKSEDVSQEIAETVSAIVEISVKSTRSVHIGDVGT